MASSKDKNPNLITLDLGGLLDQLNRIEKQHKSFASQQQAIQSELKKYEAVFGTSSNALDDFKKDEADARQLLQDDITKLSLKVDQNQTEITGLDSKTFDISGQISKLQSIDNKQQGTNAHVESQLRETAQKLSDFELKTGENLETKVDKSVFADKIGTVESQLQGLESDTERLKTDTGKTDNDV